ncbi:hypothetical protein IE81DRAFT_330547 [Ceraceosorus guamensis]|uniref:Uncharacterized protein n=1 Tax=Ceraceosorus guamensis TaxID=1522189 RepID=A0A316W2W3_9BASI|nr:hypothetical protein IE81DRAFT_330547 [Ceraceosorus guamensis]PWN41995.1 hypothetical protein IE81DRAFT_330547 [Ceraceosorus guamensis]
MRHASSRLIALSLCAAILLASVLPTSAQFFQQFFTGGGDGQVREQEAPPTGDANWFEARVEAASLLAHAFDMLSHLHILPLPSHPFLRSLALPLSMPLPTTIWQGDPELNLDQPIAKRHPATGNELFTLRGHGTPLLTLVFQEASHQHAALARMEAFYEGAGAPKGVYLDLEEASNARLCRNYQAFNLPLDSVRQWLAAMRRRHGDGDTQQVDPSETFEGASSSTSEMPWWESYCNPTECAVLRQLHSLEALVEQSNSPFRYLVSVLQRFAASSLTHEQNHALFHLVPSFASAAQRAWDDLPRKAKSIIQHDLQLRGYAESVWVDEFQAYVAEDPSEFGNVAAEACAEARDRLQQERKQGWQAIGLDS